MNLKALFDEKFYLEAHSDVAEAVRDGREKSGWSHFNRRGQFEGRAIKGFDPVFYLKSYPIVGEDIKAGAARNALDHFVKFGQARGYLASESATRPNDASGMANEFGGLWTDLPNARDIVQGKLEIGQIDSTQAEDLLFWIENGYVILHNAVEPDVLDAALIDFEKAYSGQIPELRFECEAVIQSRAASPWQPEMNSVPTKALDLHIHSKATRDLIFCRRASQFMGSVFNAPSFASQTLGFYLGSSQDGHQDSAYVAYSLPLQFCASWIALEDVTLGAGELFYYPRSHRFPNFLYLEKYKSVHEAMRMQKTNFPNSQIASHVTSLQDRARGYGLEKKVFAAKKGDILFWHADLVHGGSPISKTVTRKSVVTHYCPKFASPLYFENREIQIFHHGPHLYSTSYYGHVKPKM